MLVSSRVTRAGCLTDLSRAMVSPGGGGRVAGRGPSRGRGAPGWAGGVGGAAAGRVAGRVPGPKASRDRAVRAGAAGHAGVTVRSPASLGRPDRARALTPPAIRAHI